MGTKESPTKYVQKLFSSQNGHVTKYSPQNTSFTN